MAKYQHYPGLLSPEETDRYYEQLRQCDPFVGLKRTDFRYSSVEEQPEYTAKQAAIGQIANIVSERVDDFAPFSSETWKASILHWMNSDLGKKNLGMHRDKVGVPVAAVSIGGVATFQIKQKFRTLEFQVNPGDVVVIQNDVFIPPKHDVVIETPERLSVPIWNAYAGTPG